MATSRREAGRDVGRISANYGVTATSVGRRITAMLLPSAWRGRSGTGSAGRGGEVRREGCHHDPFLRKIYGEEVYGDQR
jgi:hypothetical protein